MTDHLDDQTKKALREQEQYHKTMSADDRKYLQERGFETREGLPQDEDNLQRPYFVLSLSRPFRIRYSDNGFIGGFIIDPTKQSADSLVGLIEEASVGIKDRDQWPNGYSNPAGQEILLFVNDPNWKPVTDKLQKRYNT